MKSFHSILLLLSIVALTLADDDYSEEAMMACFNRQRSYFRYSNSEVLCSKPVKNQQEELDAEFDALDEMEDKDSEEFRTKFCKFNYKLISTHCNDEDWWATYKCRADKLNFYDKVSRLPKTDGMNYLFGLTKVYDSINDHAIKSGSECREKLNQNHEDEVEDIKSEYLDYLQADSDLQCEYNADQIQAMNKECSARDFMKCLDEEFIEECHENYSE